MNSPLARARVASARSAPARSRPRPANASVPSRTRSDQQRRVDAVRPAPAEDHGSDRDQQHDLHDLDRQDAPHLRGDQLGPRQRRAAEPLEDAVVPLVRGRDAEVDQAVAMIASASAPGSRKSTGAPVAVGRTATEAKKSRTTTGMTIVTSTFSPRRAVSRSSIAGLGRGRRGRLRPAGSRAASRRRADELEVDVLEAAAAGPQLDDQPIAALGAPRRERGDQRRIRRRLRRPGSARRRRRATSVRPAGRPAERRSSVATSPGVERPVEPEAERAIAPGASSAGVPDATTRPPSSTTIRSASRSTSVRSWLVSRIAGPRRAGPRRSRGSRRAPPGPCPPSARRGSRPRAVRRAPARARAAGARRRTAGDSGVSRHGPQPDQVEQLVGVARVGVEPAVLAGASRAAAPAGRCRRPGASARPAPAAPGPPPRVRPEDADAPAVGAAIALDDLDGRRLARAVRARAARRARRRATVERHAVEHGSLAVALDEPVDDDRRVAGRSLRDPGVLAFEVGVGQLADLDRAEDPGPIDEVASAAGPPTR